MRFTGFIGPSYTLPSKNADCQRCINLYPVMNELGTGKEREVAMLVGTPGLRLLATIGDGPIRGMYVSSNGILFVASGNKLYSVTSSWDETELGTLSTSSGQVSMADNGISLLVVDGSASGYSVTLSSLAFASIADGDFYGADHVAFQDGYFILNRPDTGQFYISELDAITFDGADISEAEGSPDVIVGLISDHRNVLLFGPQSTEIFYNSGNADFPFEKIQGAYIPIGCDAPASIQKLQGSVYWLGRDEHGRGTVYRTRGYQADRVSTFGVEDVMRRLGNLSTATAWTYQQGGHSFYCLNLPEAESTWVFDTMTGLWHERAALELGFLERHRAECHTFAYNENVVGDYEDGRIYALDPDKYTDDGDEIPRIRTAPHITKELRIVSHYSFQLDMETGVGIDGLGQGVDPQAILQWSDDGGHSWSNERFAPVGSIGKRSNRVIWRRLGASRDRVYRVKITDPVKVIMLGVDLQLGESAH